MMPLVELPIRGSDLGSGKCLKHAKNLIRVKKHGTSHSSAVFHHSACQPADNRKPPLAGRQCCD